ncbi:MAG TPA: single-stranded-DNA-specific exonuclease RecJ [Verrucomicrobiae bacterium]|nr:single-stranded-DNA-specific exonuclease RecJ [Verrucomicrobiae bacterium]
MEKRWSVAEPCPSDFAARLGVAPMVGQLLWNRGIKTKAEAESFLHPSFEDHIHDAGQFRHMPAAIERVFKALDNHELITVHGDYDADGVTGSTLIINTLNALKANVDSYIPHRDKEGYGLHRATVPKLKERGTGLIITVDCGIACVDEIALAKLDGIDTIVIDHHTFGEIVPDGHLIHPGLPEETYPFKSLAAVGVSYKFACELLKQARDRGYAVPDGWEKWLLDLVAVATVTDMVPLVGENRVLETYGLKVLNKTRRPGFLALFEQAGIRPGAITSETVGFGIGPRINAAGRMDHASVALRLLLSESMDEARLIAQELESLNKQRQEATKKMMGEAEKQLAAQGEQGNVVVLWKEDWSPSLVGLVAGRFADKLSKPVIGIGFHETHWIGSGRSIPTYNITEAVKAAGEGILTRSGGHAQACGFALEDASKIPTFRDRLVAHAASIPKEEMVPLLAIDAEIPLSALTLEAAETMAALEPFGMGNPLPVFVSRNCRVLSSGTMGSTNAHARFQLLDESGRVVKAVAFKMGGRAGEAPLGSSIDIVYTMSVNEWNGRRSAEAHVLDFSPCIS